MTLTDAIGKIIGNRVAAYILDHMGVEWGIALAVNAATIDDDPEAIATIRAWLDKQKTVEHS